MLPAITWGWTSSSYGAFQEPIFCHGICCAPPEYHEAQMVLAPAKAPVNVTVADKVTLPPVAVTATLEAAILHWLLESVPPPPADSCPLNAVPASLVRSKRLVGGS